MHSCEHKYISGQIITTHILILEVYFNALHVVPPYVLFLCFILWWSFTDERVQNIHFFLVTISEYKISWYARIPANVNFSNLDTRGFRKKGKGNACGFLLIF